MLTIYRWNETPQEQKAKILARSGQDIDAFLPQAQAIIDRVKKEGDAGHPRVNKRIRRRRFITNRPPGYAG